MNGPSTPSSIRRDDPAVLSIRSPTRRRANRKTDAVRVDFDGLVAYAGLGVALVVALGAGGCLNLRHLDAGIRELRDIVRKQDCRDGAPARVLVDPRCVDGICGVTCAPHRWDAAPAS
jgi:hypothetical protein